MNETYRNMSIVLELDRAIKYLRLGLAEIQKVSMANDFYDPVFIYLSGGFERLFKTMLCLSFIEENNRLPGKNDIWNNRSGHDLVLLKSKVEDICIPVSRPFAAMDYDIITKDVFVNQICKTLSAFGKRARYFNLDAILGEEQEYNPKKEWEKMETTLGKELYGTDEFYKLLTNPKELERSYEVTNREITVRLEKFFRALTRQFIFGNFSSNSKTFLFEIESFSDIDDNQLGKTDYRKYEIYERIKRTNYAQ